MFWVATEISIIRFCHYLGFFPLGKPMHVGARKSRVWRLQVTGVKYAHNYLHKQKLYNESIGITLTKHVGHPEVKKLYYPPLFFKWILQRFLLITHTWNCWVVCWKVNWNCVSVKKSSVKELKRNKDRIEFLSCCRAQKASLSSVVRNGGGWLCLLVLGSFFQGKKSEPERKIDLWVCN